MKIILSKKDKIELLKAIQIGELDIMRVPSIWQQIQGANALEEIMKSIDAEISE